MRIGEKVIFDKRQYIVSAVLKDGKCHLRQGRELVMYVNPRDIVSINETHGQV